MSKPVVSYCAIALLLILFAGGIVHVSVRQKNQDAQLEELASSGVLAEEADAAPAEAPVAVIPEEPVSAPVVVVEEPAIPVAVVAETPAPAPIEAPIVVVEPPAAAPVETPVVIVEKPASVPVETPVAVVVENPASVEAPVVIVEKPASVSEAPIAVVEKPASVPEASIVIVEKPASIPEVPIAVVEKPASVPVVEAPVAAVEKPVSASMETPAVAPPAKNCVKPSCSPKACQPCSPPICRWKFNPCNPKGQTMVNCGDFILSADFLYWRGENHGFSYAYQLNTSDALSGKILRVNPSWDPGVRVGCGWNTPYNFWDVFLNYTWIRNCAAQTNTNALGFIRQWPVSTATTGEFLTVSANTRFTVNMGDLEVGRLIYLTQSVAIRPHLGARGGTIAQRFNDFFTGLLSGSNSEAKFAGKNSYWGVGPRMGLNGEWHLNRGFSLLGKFAGALLYGNTEASSLSTRLPTGSSSFVVERHYTDEFNQLVPNMQMSVGFQWQTCFRNEKMFYRVSASWETNYWWDQFNLPFGASSPSPFPTVGNQAFSMEGATLNMEWDF